ncbi:hypothetical protein ACQSMD_17475 [Streptomyces flavovirens]|uniref:hypothetical protein n=1 Tax=Streptomyces flavovirens TaxID=52258 RepID=UPI003D0CBF1E
MLVSVVIAAVFLFRKLGGGGSPAREQRPWEQAHGPSAARPDAHPPAHFPPRQGEPEYERPTPEMIVPPTVGGHQHLVIDTGAEDTKCTLSSYSDRVALGRADPYLVIRIPASTRAQLYDLRAGTYDILIETGQDWDRESNTFRMPRSQRRSMQPLRLFGPHTLILTTYPVQNGDFFLTDI